MGASNMPPGPDVKEYEKHIDPSRTLRKEELRLLAVSCFREMIGTYQRDSREVREMITECIPSWPASEVMRASKSPRFHWCGIALLTALRRAGLTDRTWSWNGVGGYGFILRDDYGHLPVTKNPLAGDCFIGPPDAYHHGMVVERSLSRDARMMLRSVEGNTPTCVERYRAEPRGYTYYSIEPFLDAVIQKENG